MHHLYSKQTDPLAIFTLLHRASYSVEEIVLLNFFLWFATIGKDFLPCTLLPTLLLP